MKKINLSYDTNRQQTINKILDKDNKVVSPRAKLMAKVILLKSQNKNINEIISETGLSKRTIEYCIASFFKDNKGFYGFIHKKGNKTRKSELSKNKEILDYFKDNKPHTYKEATETIKAKYGIEKNISTVRRWLIKNNINTSKDDRT